MYTTQVRICVMDFSWLDGQYIWNNISMHAFIYLDGYSRVEPHNKHNNSKNNKKKQWTIIRTTTTINNNSNNSRTMQTFLYFSYNLRMSIAQNDSLRSKISVHFDHLLMVLSFILSFTHLDKNVYLESNPSDTRSKVKNQFCLLEALKYLQ